MSSSPDGGSRILELDALRGFAAFWVLLFHHTSYYHELFGHSPEWGIFWPSGLFGVYLFFILSGFVITMTLERMRRPLDFVVSRFSRLYPAYWAAVLLTTAAVSLSGLPGAAVSGPELALNFTMAPHLFGARFVDGVYWSLQIELFFYMVMLALYVCGARRRLEDIGVFWVLAGALFSWVRPEHPWVHGAGVALVLPFCHLFVLGIVFYGRSRRGAWTRRGAMLAVLCVMAHALNFGVRSACFIGWLCLVFECLCRGHLKILRARPLVFMGTISYPVYLLHQNIGYILIRQGYEWGWSSALAIGAAIAGVTAASALLTFGVERPAMRVIRAAYRRRSPAASAA